jgi:hypothetical protein
MAGNVLNGPRNFINFHVLPIILRSFKVCFFLTATKERLLVAHLGLIISNRQVNREIGISSSFEMKSLKEFIKTQENIQSGRERRGIVEKDRKLGLHGLEVARTRLLKM